MWNDEFKIALIEKDTQRLEELVNVELKFDTFEEIEEAMYLIKEANRLFTKLKDETAVSLNQLKKNIDFLKATQSPFKNRLDITS